VRDFLKEADMPAGGGALVLLSFVISKKKGQLERFGKADELKLRGGRTR
jgi:hypothetical protein